MPHLTPQQQLIVEMLSDNEYHCPTVELYMKDDRKRFSELKQIGYVIDSKKYCQNEKHHHQAKVKVRKLLFVPTVLEIREEKKEDVQNIGGLFPAVSRTAGRSTAYRL